MKNTLIYPTLGLLIIFGTFFRFYNLNWGEPYYFHPDERNIASSISQLDFPGNLDPNFFAYGSLPIYFIYFIGILINFIFQYISQRYTDVVLPVFSVSFPLAIVISRFISAFFSVLLIPILYYLGIKLKNKTTGIFAATLAAFSTGLIQFAHFGTFEMWLTFFTVILFWLCLKMLKNKNKFYVILTGIAFGVLAATKVSHLSLLPLPILALLFRNIEKTKIPELHENIDGNADISANPQHHKYRYSVRLNLPDFIKMTLKFVTAAIIVYLISNPFVFQFNIPSTNLQQIQNLQLSDYVRINPAFTGSMNYETGVALGTLPVFYTGEFKNSIPVIFQFLNIYPFLINPLLTFLFIPSLLYLVFASIKEKKVDFILLIFYFLILFFSQVFLYVKWTRYMIPTLPFIYLICAIAFADFWKFLSKKHQLYNINYLLFGLIFFVSFIFAVSYFITAFIRDDTRIAAKIFAKQFIPQTAPIISEVYDLGITPFNESFANIKLYNFYDMDNNSIESSPAVLAQQLENSEYIILPSQRILQTRIQDPKNFPNGYIFYTGLMSELNGYKKIYETPCDFFCSITYLNSPVFSFEQTASVFDRPTVLIFKKI